MLTTTDEDVLRRFAAVVGVGHVTGPRRHKQAGTEHHKPYFTWFTGTFEGMQAVTAMFWPFLGERRRGRALALLTYLRDRPKKFADGVYCNAKLTVEAVQEIRRLRGKRRQVEVAAQFGISQSHVNDIQRGTAWSHIPYDEKEAAKNYQRKGEDHPLSKITADQVKEIRSLAGTLSQQKIASRYGLSQTTVSAIVRRVIWKHVEAEAT
jgi:predicted XRE-type DNA-binding protein